MQIIRDIEQGSEEWLKMRLGVATASNFSKIITSTGAKSATLPKCAMDLAAELMLEQPEPTYKNDIMQRGNDLEQEARNAYEQEKLEVVDTVTMFKSDCGNFGYSPDGLVSDEGLIEIKCPLATTHLKYLLDGKLPTDYVQQVQGGLWVSGRQWCDFVSFNPNFKERKLFIVRVVRDEVFISKLAELAGEVVSLRDGHLLKLKGK